MGLEVHNKVDPKTPQAEMIAEQIMDKAQQQLASMAHSINRNALVDAFKAGQMFERDFLKKEGMLVEEAEIISEENADTVDDA